MTYILFTENNLDAITAEYFDDIRQLIDECKSLENIRKDFTIYEVGKNVSFEEILENWESSR